MGTALRIGIGVKVRSRLPGAVCEIGGVMGKVPTVVINAGFGNEVSLLVSGLTADELVLVDDEKGQGVKDDASGGSRDEEGGGDVTTALASC